MPEPEKTSQEAKMQKLNSDSGGETSDNGNSHFGKLPKEIVEMILSLLPYTTLRRTAPFVCKSWAESVQSCAFWRQEYKNRSSRKTYSLLANRISQGLIR